MYKHFYGLRESPFNVNPDPRYLFLTPRTQEALDQMISGIRSRKGLMLLTGEVGTGKTTLINRLLDLLRQERTPTAFIFNSHLETSHLFDFIMADFGITFDSRLKGNALMRLNQWLMERFRAGQTPVLIVDEAQGLPVHLLEEIRMLLNLETSNQKLLQIVLSGQPELEERLKRSELRQLKQRIMLRCRTATLTLEDCHDYIQSRLQMAGGAGEPVFASEAIDAVHFYSRGIPRIVNLLCENALINAYAAQVRPVPARIIEQIAREFQFDDIRPLAPSMDSGDSLRGHVIAMQSTYPSGLVRAPEATGPPPKRAEERQLSVSTAFASGADFQLIAELGMARGALAPPPRPHLVETKDKIDPMQASVHRQVCSQPKTAHPAIAVNAPGSGQVASRLMTLVALAAGSTAGLKDRLLRAVRSPAWTQISTNFLQRLKSSLLSIRAWLGWRVARSGKTLTSIGFDDWPRMKAFVYQWLRQPCDPVQWLQRGWDPAHWRLPDSLQFEARRKFSHKKT